jgi:aryl sulfotransferase
VTGIVWLASYPKSGNTWFRVFLTNFLRDTSEPASINALFATPIASGRQFFDETLAIDAGDLTHDEYDSLRPDVYRAIAARAGETPYMKIHDANINTVGGEPLIPFDATSRAIYFVRDPRDVAVSLANHLGLSTGSAVAAMADVGFEFSSGVRGMPLQLRQRLLTWSGHVESWVDDVVFAVHVMRYEDMLARPAETFGAAVEFLGLPADEARLERAVRFSAFDELRRQESDGGFREKPENVEWFFHLGRVGAWREHLTAEEEARVVADQGAVMRRFGYVGSPEEVPDPVSLSGLRA